MMDIKIGTEVTLSKKQIDYCELLAIQKMERHRGLGVEDLIVKAGDNGFDRDFSSIKAQMAITIAAGSKFNSSTQPRSAFLGTDQPHTVFSDGTSITVRTTKYKNGHLASGLYKKPVADLFVLLIEKGDTFIIKGFIKQKDFYKKERIKYLGDSEVYAVRQDELFEYEQLV